MQFDFFEEDPRLIYETVRKMKGRVRWFERELGYGFITPDAVNEEIFFHYTALQIPGYKNIRKGQKVIFERCTLEAAPDKPVAKNIVPIMEDNKDTENST